MSILTITKEDTFNNFVTGSQIDKIKATSDAIDSVNDLTRPLKKQRDGIKSKACFAYGERMERKRLQKECAEVWDD